MKRALSLVFVAAVAATPVLADGRGKDRGGHGDRQAAFCPPGLAKKNPPCVPPGQAKKYVHRGDHYYEYDHHEVDPYRHHLDPRYGWYRIGPDIMVRTDRKTGEILELFDAIVAVLD